MPSHYRIERWKGSGGPEPATLSSILVSEGYSVFQWTDAPGAVYDVHSHNNDQSHWIISGTLELNVEGAGKFLLKAGDRDFMPADTNHSAKVIGDEPVVYLIGGK